MIEYRGKEYYNTMKMSSSTLTIFLEKSPRKVAGSDMVERVSAKKKTGVFFSIFRLVRVSDFWIQNFFVYAFITTFLLYVQLM